jgi:N-acetylmuramoyl-L-alanine amidase
MQEEFLDQSIALAKMIQDNFSGTLKRNDRKVKQAGFIVLHQTFMPSVLVETGFLTNKNEGAYLNSKAGQSQMGTAIAEAILIYKGGVQSNVAETKQQTVSSDVVKAEGEPIKKEVITDKPEKTVAVKEILEEKVDEKTNEPEKAVTEINKPKIEEKEQAITNPIPENDVAVVDPKIDKKEQVEVPAPIKETIVKEETPKAPKKETVASNKPKVLFKVQLMASVKDLELQPKNFNGLGRLSKEPYKNMYRYMYGTTNSFKEAEMLKSNADRKGYTTSYIVAYKDGERIALNEARKYASE